MRGQARNQISPVGWCRPVGWWMTVGGKINLDHFDLGNIYKACSNNSFARPGQPRSRCDQCQPLFIQLRASCCVLVWCFKLRTLSTLLQGLVSGYQKSCFSYMLEMAPHPASKAYMTNIFSKKLMLNFMSRTSLPIKRDGVFTTSEMTPLTARPIAHLGVWAYLAIGAVVFFSVVIIGYVVFSCYDSSRTRRRRSAGTSKVNTGIAESRKTTTREVTRCEKPRTGPNKMSARLQPDLTGRRPGHKWMPSESHVCYFLFSQSYSAVTLLHNSIKCYNPLNQT